MTHTNTAFDKDQQPTHFNETDGHTYWLNDQGELWAAPTFANGEVDYENRVYVDDFDVPILPEERHRIHNLLTTAAHTKKGAV